MDKKEIWINTFTRMANRQPSVQEVQLGASHDYDVSMIGEIVEASQVSPQEKWVTAFRNTFGREPSRKEIQIASTTKFDLSTIDLFKAQSTQGTQPQGIQPQGTQPQGTQPQGTQPRTEPVMTVPQPTPQKSGISRYLILGGITVLVMAAVGYLYGLHYYSKDAVIERYAVAVEEGDVDTALAYEAWSDNKEDISEESLDYVTDEMIELSSENLEDRFEKTGKQWLVFPKWRVLVEPVTYVIQSNTEGLSLSINGKALKGVTETEVDAAYRVKRLYPADYTFEASGNIDEKDVNISYTSYDTEALEYSAKERLDGLDVNLNLTYLSATISSNLKDGELYVDDNKVGSLKDGSLKVKDYATVEDSVVYVKKTFSDQSFIESNYVSVSDIDSGSKVSLNAKLLTKDKAKQVLDSGFTKLSYPTTQTATIEDVFVDGTANSFYKNVQQTVERNTKDAKKRAAKSVDMRNVKVKSIKQTSKNLYEVEFTFDYDFYYAPASGFVNSGSLIQTMSYSCEMEYVGDASSDGSTSNYRITRQLSEATVTSTQNQLR